MTYADDITLAALRRIEPGEELTVNYRELEGEFHDTVDAGAAKPA